MDAYTPHWYLYQYEAKLIVDGFMRTGFAVNFNEEEIRTESWLSEFYEGGEDIKEATNIWFDSEGIDPEEISTSLYDEDNHAVTEEGRLLFQNGEKRHFLFTQYWEPDFNNVKFVLERIYDVHGDPEDQTTYYDIAGNQIFPVVPTDPGV